VEIRSSPLRMAIMKRLLSMMPVLAFACVGRAEVRTKAIEYRHGDMVLEGWLAYDDSVQGKRPGVMIIHQWKGLTDYEKKRAEMVARLGYVAFACDIYGKGVRPSENSEAAHRRGSTRTTARFCVSVRRPGWRC